MSTLTEVSGISMELALPCCDGSGKCDGQSLLRLGASFTAGDLALLSFSIPTDQLKRPPDDESESQTIRLWYVVVATDGQGEERVLTGILSGEAQQTLSRRVDTDTVGLMEPIKFTPRHVCGGLRHQGVSWPSEGAPKFSCASGFAPRFFGGAGHQVASSSAVPRVWT